MAKGRFAGLVLGWGLVATSAVVIGAGSTAEASVQPALAVRIDATLGCDIEHRDDPLLGFYSPQPTGAPDRPVACGTFVAIGGVLYGPSSSPGMFQANDPLNREYVGPPGPRPFRPVSQTPVSGSGTDDDPFVVVTKVRAGRTGIELVQTDRWTTTAEYVSTRIDVVNHTRRRHAVQVYRAGDCQDGSYASFGRVADGRAACLVATYDRPSRDVARFVPGDAVIEFSGGAGLGVSAVHEVAGAGMGIENRMVLGLPLRKTCTDCADPDRATDRTIALGWSVSVPSRRTATVHTETTVSTGAVRPISTVEAWADPAAPQVVTARLTSGGQPLGGQLLRFLRDGSEVCRVVTDDAGTATCVATPPASPLDPAGPSLAGAPTVDVMFDGNLDVRPSMTWVVTGAAPADPGMLPGAPACLPVNRTGIAGVVPGAGTMILVFAQGSCPSVRYAAYDPSGRLLAWLPGDGTDRLELEFSSITDGTLVISRLRQPDVVLLSSPFGAVSPAKAVG